jgi:hypothetical protein
MTVKVEKRFSKGLTFLSAYTWSKTIDNVDETLSNSGVGALKPWDRNLNRGRSTTDLRHNYVVSASYELPFGKGKTFMNANRAADLVFGGWQLGGILTLQTGLPFTVNSGGGITNAGGADRPGGVYDAGAVHVWQLGPEHFGRTGEPERGSVAGQELRGDREGSGTVPGRVVQRDEHGEFRVPRCEYQCRRSGHDHQRG